MTNAFAAPLREKASPPLSGDQLVHAVGPLFEAFEAKVIESFSCLKVVSVEMFADNGEVVRSIVEAATREVLTIISPTLIFEFHLSKLMGRLSNENSESYFANFASNLRSDSTFLLLVEKYPMLIEQVSVTLAKYVISVEELIRNLAIDQELLADAYGVSDIKSGLTRLKFLGDWHGQGHQVICLEFVSGVKIAYKPRSLSIDARFQDLLHCINRLGFRPQLSTLMIHDRGMYGWSEWCDHYYCQSAQELEAFYQRVGGLLCLFDLLGAIDLHYENAIAHASEILFIDLETLFHPEVGWSSRDGDRLARVGILPSYKMVNAARGSDLTLFGAIPGGKAPYHNARIENNGTDEIKVSMIQPTIEKVSHRPVVTLSGVFEKVDIPVQVAFGFAAMYETLLANQHSVDLSHAVLQFAGCSQRIVFRNTAEYQDRIGRMYSPFAQSSSAELEKCVELPDLPNLQHCEPLYMAYEKKSLKAGNVPIFTSSPGSSEVWTGDGASLGEMPWESGLQGTLMRLKAMDKTDKLAKVAQISALLNGYSYNG